MKHTKGLLTENKKIELEKLDHLATDCFPLDSTQQPLSVMKTNSQTYKYTQTIKDRSIPLKNKCLNDVIQP